MASNFNPDLPLTDIQEPGFFSQIQISPSLFLVSGSVYVVGLIGEGSATQSISSEAVSSAGPVDTLAKPISDIAKTSSDTCFHFPSTSFRTYMVGTENLGGTFTDLKDKTFILKVNGTALPTVTFADPTTTLDGVVSQLNAIFHANHPGIPLVSAIAISSSALGIVSGMDPVGDGGQELQVGAGTANAALGFANGQICQAIDWTPAGGSVDPDIQPQTVSGARKYYVNYDTPKGADNTAPQTFYSLAQMTAVYGLPSLANTLSLGGMAAFGNGASVVIARQLTPGYSDLSAEVTLALTDMEAQHIDVLVPMTTDTALWPKYLYHVSKMSSLLERAERRVILSVDETGGLLPLTGSGSWTALMQTFVPNDNGLEPKRVMVVSPGYALTTTMNSQIVVPGTYLAACIGGLMCSPANLASTSMTKKALATVDNIYQPEHLRSEKNLLTSLGVTVVEMSGALAAVRRSLTPDNSSVANQEPSIVFALDVVARDVRLSMGKRFSGTTIDKSTAAKVKAAAEEDIGIEIGKGLIADRGDVSAVQNPNEPRQFDISANVSPLYPFLWGLLNFSVVL